MKNKLRSFRCHICKNIVFITDKNKVKCSKCGSEYNLKDGKFFRENWITRAYGKQIKD